MYMNELKIPRERVAILIGKKGADKKKLEKKTNTKINVGKEGDVEVSAEDNFDVFLTCNIIKAIARGFNPDIALTLLDEENCLEIINIIEEIGKSKKKLIRMKSRVIGTKGKAKHNIERLTNTKISIYGKTVSIIGDIEDVSIAREGIESLLKGAPHGNAYRLIERKLSLKKTL